MPPEKAKVQSHEDMGIYNIAFVEGRGEAVRNRFPFGQLSIAVLSLVWAWPAPG